MIAPRMILTEPTHNVAFWNNVVITNVQGHVDAAGVRGICATYHELYRTYSTGIAGITILRASLTVGTTDTNAEAKIAMREMRDKMLHVAIVIESEGMLASLLKAVIRTLNSVARSSLLSLAADLEEAARVVVPYVKERTPRQPELIQAELLEALETTRRVVP
jgi:hypothetical protein